ncbi:MAG TPA: AraC family transcriptional regulator, partial [Thermoanaerobaculia bacterium]|nr:AraC family transcriptional regulator [Thermoanaerobaculia bacterium]
MESDVATLAMLIGALVPYDGTIELRVPGVRAARASHTNQEPMYYLQRSTLCIVAQGAKIVMIGGDTYGYKAGQMAVYSIDVPMAGRVTRASYSEPYLLLMIDLDAEKIAELAPKVFPHGLPQPRDSRSLYVGDAGPHIIDAATRLLELMAQPIDAELLAPLVRDEILIRLLRSPLGSRVAHIGRAGSSVQRIANAVSRLRANFDQIVNIEELAKLVNMSVTSFHRQFKAVTGMSPLQYQKTLRLQEARRLMLATMIDAGSAGRRVGYGSASQFSREYNRFFGSAPAKDINRLREVG